MSREINNDDFTTNPDVVQELPVEQVQPEVSVEPAQPAVAEPVAPEVIIDNTPQTIELISTEPVVEKQPENVINATIVEEKPMVDPQPEVKVESPVVDGNKVAVFALRSLTLPSGTIKKGYSFINKSEYEKVAKHKAIRLASKEEISTYLN